jgi:hypothetical protein
MPQLPVMSGREAVRAFKKHGWEVTRQRGSHIIMVKADQNVTDDEFLAAARRAFKRVARQLRLENGRLGLPLIAGKNGRVCLIRSAEFRASSR